MDPISLAYIQNIRKRLYIKQSEMAEALGYDSAAGYSALETGKVKMTVEQLIQIIKILNLSQEEVFTFILKE